VPALLAWESFRKSGVGLFSLDSVVGGLGVKENIVFGYRSFGGLDPTEWMSRGFAVMNVDLRGAFDFEGNLR
jgi:predicted acyl esterase